MEKLSLCYRNRAEITVFICEQMPYGYSVDTESVAEPSCFLSRYVVGVPFVYFDYILESCWLKTRNFVGSMLVKNM